MRSVLEIEVGCPSCGAKPGEDCYTPIDGVDTKWNHDTRILRAMFTDDPARPVDPVMTWESE